MSAADGRHARNPSQRQTPVVRIVSRDTAGVAAARAVASQRRHNASATNINTVIVMTLLLASTALALYDLYLLLSILAAGR